MCIVFYGLIDAGEFFACVQDTTQSLIWLQARTQTATDCIAICTGTRPGFAAVGEIRLLCSCFYAGDEYMPDSVPFSRCNTTCPGNRLESCGGDGLFSVYKSK